MSSQQAPCFPHQHLGEAEYHFPSVTTSSALNNLDAFSFKGLSLFLLKSLNKNIPIDPGKGSSYQLDTVLIQQAID